jgi:hypothetical protein
VPPVFFIEKASETQGFILPLVGSSNRCGYEPTFMRREENVRTKKKSEVRTVPFDPVKFVADLVEQGKLADSEIDTGQRPDVLGDSLL